MAFSTYRRNKTYNCRIEIYIILLGLHCTIFYIYMNLFRTYYSVIVTVLCQPRANSKIDLRHTKDFCCNAAFSQH